jgi:tRNA threonylcarbamoyladenosine biosynthesis protein TsaE
LGQFKIQKPEDWDMASAFLLKSCPQTRVFTFSGQMGAGKTTFIKALCRQLGVTENTSSPTFSIINEYARTGNSKIIHFDFFRIKDPSEAYDLGCEEYFWSENICMIEWPEKIPDLIPAEAININITLNGTERIITF